MSGASPGPWQWGVHDGLTRLYDADGRVIATGNYRRGVTVEGAGNRALIAAAPTLARDKAELMEALTAMVRLAGQAEVDHSEACAIHSARALLARLNTGRLSEGTPGDEPPPASPGGRGDVR